MAYTLFGGGPADVTTDATGAVIAGVQLEVYTHPTGGLRVTDLRDATGTPLPGRVASSAGDSDPADRGRVRFQAPDTYHLLYLDRGYGDRWQVSPTTLGQTVATAVSRSEAALAQSQQAVDDAAAALAAERAYVDVRAYGARADGVTDNTTAFRAAVQHVGSQGGGTLHIPAGVFVVQGHVPLVSDLHIDGWGAVLTKQPGASSYAFFSAQSEGRHGYGSSVRRVSATGITFQGDFTAGVTVCGFALHHAASVTISNCRFVEAQGNGHCIDLAGCEDVTISGCAFLGFLEPPAGSTYRRTECIQIDISTSGSVSVVDTPGSFDGLPTRNVTVESCRFEPLTVGLTEFPAPNPLGSHAKREGAIAENIVFRGNTVGRLTVDLSSALRGGIHFTGIRGLVIEGNTFDCPANTRLIGLYVETTGAPASSDPNGTAPTNLPIAPLPVEDILISNNTIRIGFADTVNIERHIYIAGKPAARARGVRITGNRFEFSTVYGWALTVDHVDGLHVTDNRGAGIHIALAVTTGADVVSRGNTWMCAAKTPQSYDGQSTEQFRTVSGLVVDGSRHVDPLDPAVWVGEGCEDVTISGQTVLNPKQTTANRGDGIRVAGASRFTITGCKITTDNTVAKAVGIEVYGAATSKGLVTGNVITGFTALVNLNGLATVTQSGNI